MFASFLGILPGKDAGHAESQSIRVADIPVQIILLGQHTQPFNGRLLDPVVLVVEKTNERRDRFAITVQADPFRVSFGYFGNIKLGLA